MRRTAITGAFLITAGLTLGGCSDPADSSECRSAELNYYDIAYGITDEYMSGTITSASYTQGLNNLFNARDQLVESCGSEEGLSYALSIGIPSQSDVYAKIAEEREAAEEEIKAAEEEEGAPRPTPSPTKEKYFGDSPGENFALEDLRNAKFRGADLKKANFKGADLRGALFIGADLRGATFEEADLRGANFKRADLRDASFKCANAGGVNFRRADLRDADFRLYNGAFKEMRGAKTKGMDETDISCNAALTLRWG